MLAPFREKAVLKELDREECGGQAERDRNRARAVPDLRGVGAVDEDERDEQEQLPGEPQQVRVREDIFTPLVIPALHDFERDEEQQAERSGPVPAGSPFAAGQVEKRCRGNGPARIVFFFFF